MDYRLNIFLAQLSPVEPTSKMRVTIQQISKKENDMRILANGININVDVRGEAEPALVFLHYWGGSSPTWGDVIRRLDGNHRTVAIDFRGLGDSDKPATGYRIEELASDVTTILAELKISRFILVGHSMGAKVAQFVASKRPAGLLGLVLVATGSPHGVKVPEEQLQRMIHAYDSAGSAAFVRDNILTKRPLPDDLKAQVVEETSRPARPPRWHGRAWPLPRTSPRKPHPLLFPHW
jgi:pimeloyl-ACP methyl ester carboxylesterase